MEKCGKAVGFLRFIFSVHQRHARLT